MECLYPILIKKKEWLPPVKVPCSQCIACRLNRARDWSIRIMHEVKMHNGKACFLTLTYNQENAPWVSDFQATLVKKDVQDFMKRLRKRLEPAKIRYYLCGEYGENYGRPHYHIIVFGLSVQDAERVVRDCWLFGFVHIGSVTVDSANYVARYCTKLLTGKGKEWYIDRNIIPEFSLMSRRPGIGAGWLEKYGNEVKTHHKVVVKGKEVTPPRYYRDKLYDESDRCVVRDSSLDYIIAKERQLTDDVLNFPGMEEERIRTREKTILARLKKRGG